MASVSEHVLSIDKFQRPMTLEDDYAIHALLVRLILMEPGTYETHPEMGVGLVSKYRFGVDMVDELRSEIKKQIATYLPQFQNVEVQVQGADKTVGIRIRVEDNWYDLNFDKETFAVSDL